jgi:hypothetical protein
MSEERKVYQLQESQGASRLAAQSKSQLVTNGQGGSMLSKQSQATSQQQSSNERKEK